MRPKISMTPLFKIVILMFAVLSMAACSIVATNAKKEFAQDLSATILEFDDPETIKKAVPAYLVLISSMIKGDPENVELLESGAKLYSAYASGFAESVDSKRVLVTRALAYSSRAMCLRNSNFCDIKSISYFEFERRLATIDKSQAEPLFIFVSSWTGVIEANSSDWNAVAELPKVKAGLQRVINIDETVSNGNAHLYMAVLESLLPPALGGKPDIAKKHFDRAIELSNGENLMAKVLYAEKYARLLFNRELHDQLLKQVIEADVGTKNLVLSNALAKQRAVELLASADDYF